MTTTLRSCGLMWGATALVGLLTLGCGSAATPIDAASPANLLSEPLQARVFTSQPEVRATIRAASQARSTCISATMPSPRNLPPDMARVVMDSAPGVAQFANSAPMSASGASSAARSLMMNPSMPTAYNPKLDYSVTNVQHGGIDESHIIKTDGHRIYTVTDQSLFILDTQMGNGAKMISSVLLPGKASGLFVSGDSIVVVGRFVDRKKLIDEDSLDQLTYVAVYDRSAGSYPKLAARHVFEGSFVDGRLQGDVAYFVVTSKAFVRDSPTPIVASGQQTSHVPVSRTLAFRQPRRRPSFATVHALPLSSPQQVSSKSVMVGNLSVVYMSPTSLYLADSGHPSLADIASRLLPEVVGPHLTPDDKELIGRIEAVDADLFSPLEKRDKITNVLCDRLEAMDEQEETELRRRVQVGVSEIFTKTGAVSTTAIHRFDIGDLEITLGPTGVVAGQPLNQFAFDEHKGTLRVATTRADDNAVYALNRALEVVGEVGDLGINERIYAARYLGDRLYLVTFRQVDPFYVIDLSNPTKLRKLGELKLPGVSKYLHPWDANLVLGIGTSQGARRGLKIALFDVTQVRSPQIHAELIAEDLTPSLPSAFGHRALIVDPRRGLLVVPVTGRDSRGVGALVLKGNAQGFREQGVVVHDSAQWTRMRSQSIEGSLYVQNMLYTKSPDMVRASSLADLEEVATAFLR